MLFQRTAGACSHPMRAQCGSARKCQRCLPAVEVLKGFQIRARICAAFLSVIERNRRNAGAQMKLIAASACCRVGNTSRGRGRLGVTACAYPWTEFGAEAQSRLPKLWSEVQYKPDGGQWLHSVRLSSRDTSLQFYSAPMRMPGLLGWMRAQVSCRSAWALPALHLLE